MLIFISISRENDYKMHFWVKLGSEHFVYFYWVCLQFSIFYDSLRKKILFLKKETDCCENQTLTVLAKILMCYTTYIKKTFVLKTFDSLFCVLYMIWFFFLFFAAYSGHKEIVRVLIDNGANIDHQNQYGQTALYWAGK